MLYWLYTANPDNALLNVLRYPSFRILMSAFTALVICLLAYPPFIRRLQVFKFGQAVRDDGPQTHLKKQGTPTMGGTLMLSPGFVTDALGIVLILPFTRPAARRLLTRVVARRLLSPNARRPGPGSGGSVVRGEVVDE